MSEARVRGGSMLWLMEDGKAPIEEKIARAATFYQEKYGKKATRCRLNPRSLRADEKFPVSVGDTRVLVDNRVLVQHLAIGED